MATNVSVSPLLNQMQVSEAVNAGTFIFLVVFTCVGNLLLLAVVARGNKLHQTANHFTLSLILASLLMATTVMPLRVLSFVEKGRWINEPEFCEAYSTCFVLCCLVTVLSLIAMSVDRYFAISKTLAYQKFMAGWRSFIIIGLCWLAAIVLAVAPAKYHGVNAPNMHDCKLTRVYSLIYVYIFVSIEVLAPVAFMLLLHVRMLKRAVGHFRMVDIDGAKLKNLDSSDCPSFTKEAQWARLTIKVTLSFIVFWIPRCVFLLVDNSQSATIHDVADGLTEIMTYCFPASLPLLYASWSADFRDEFVKMLCPVGMIRQQHDRQKYKVSTPNKVRPISCTQYT